MIVYVILNNALIVGAENGGVSDEVILDTQRTLTFEVVQAGTDTVASSKDVRAPQTDSTKSSNMDIDKIRDVGLVRDFGLKENVLPQEKLTEIDYMPVEILKTPTKRKTDNTNAVASSSGAIATKKTAKRNIFHSDDYLPDEFFNASPKSPTPPPKKKQFQPPLKKGIGKSTVKPSTSSQK